MMQSFLTISFYQRTVGWLQNHLFACPFKKYLHIDCPGCGFQRSFIFLLKGEWISSFEMYPATLPILFLFLFTALHLKFNFLNGATIIKYSQIVVAIIIFVFYIYKIINHKITA